jgi:hypothetical protein
MKEQQNRFHFMRRMDVETEEDTIKNGKNIWGRNRLDFLRSQDNTKTKSIS